MVSIVAEGLSGVLTSIDEREFCSTVSVHLGLGLGGIWALPSAEHIRPLDTR